MLEPSVEKKLRVMDAVVGARNDMYGFIEGNLIWEIYERIRGWIEERKGQEESPFTEILAEGCGEGMVVPLDDMCASMLVQALAERIAIRDMERLNVAYRADKMVRTTIESQRNFEEEVQAKPLEEHKALLMARQTALAELEEVAKEEDGVDDHAWDHVEEGRNSGYLPRLGEPWGGGPVYGEEQEAATET